MTNPTGRLSHHVTRPVFERRSQPKAQREVATSNAIPLGALVRTAVVSFSIFPLCGCFGPEHMDSSRYEYLYADGRFQLPYSAFPQGSDRANWKCHDKTAGKAFDCTMVRGGWDQFQYIYRDRR